MFLLFILWYSISHENVDFSILGMGTRCICTSREKAKLKKAKAGDWGKERKVKKKRNNFAHACLSLISVFICWILMFNTQSAVTGLCFHLVLTLLNILIIFSSHRATVSWSETMPHPKYVLYFQNQDFFVCLIKERKSMTALTGLYYTFLAILFQRIVSHLPELRWLCWFSAVILPLG